MEEKQHPLEALYGANAFDLALQEIRTLQQNSNIPFDKEYLNLGISFLNMKAIDILDGKKSTDSLSSLVSESFGEAAIYKYNVCGA